MSPFALLDPAVAVAHTLLRVGDARLEPVVGCGGVALSLVLITVLVRLCLVPLSVRVARAEQARRSLAPTLDHLRRRHGADRARLLREVRQAQLDAGVSPVAGLLPGLAQAPVLTVLYRLCTATVIAGTPNVVLTANLAGVPLAQHGLAIVSTAGLVSAPALVLALMLAALSAVAVWSGCVTCARMVIPGIPPPPRAQLVVARVLPFGTVAMAMALPFAASLYLLTSTAWAVAERVVLPQLI